MAPPVGRAVRSRVQRTETAARSAVSDAETRVDRWGERLVEAVVRTGDELIDALPTQTPQPWVSPSPPPPPPAPAFAPALPPVALPPWPWPVTNFRQQTRRRFGERMGRP